MTDGRFEEQIKAAHRAYRDEGKSGPAPVMDRSGLQVSFFRALEAIVDETAMDRQAVFNILTVALSDNQRALATDRWAAYEHRRHHAEQAWANRMARNQATQERGGTGPARCRACNRFKSRPSDVCNHCGDDPVTHGGSRREYDRAILGQ